MDPPCHYAGRRPEGPHACSGLLRVSRAIGLSPRLDRFPWTVRSLLVPVTKGFIATPESNMKLWGALAARLHARTLEEVLASIPNLDASPEPRSGLPVKEIGDSNFIEDELFK